MIKPIVNILFIIFSLSFADNNTIKVSAPITTEISGNMGIVANQSVVHINCVTTNLAGTGFYHKSGWIITAAHVVEKCPKNDIFIITSTNEIIKIDSIISDVNLDIAILKPLKQIAIKTLSLSKKTEISVGTMVSTWGFPSGYNGISPLLSVGYLSGVDRTPIAVGFSPARWVVNAAFNSGNSGGPVIDIESGEVIGVVSSKLAPIPLLIENALNELSKQKYGMQYTMDLPNGQKQSISEGQVVAAVLQYLRSQTQLVLGHAVTSTDLIQFLNKNKIKD